METPKQEQPPRRPEESVDARPALESAEPPVIVGEDLEAEAARAEKLRTLHERAPDTHESGPSTEDPTVHKEKSVAGGTGVAGTSALDSKAILKKIQGANYGSALSGRAGKLLGWSMAGVGGVAGFAALGGEGAAIAGFPVDWSFAGTIFRGLGVVEIFLAFPFFIGWGAEQIRKLAGSGGGGSRPSGGGGGQH